MGISWYGRPGSLNDMIAMDDSAATNQLLPDGFVKMEILTPPDDGRLYVISLTGAWELCMDNERIRIERQKRYLEAYPMAQQLEAMMDKENGDATKWNEMQKTFEKIRELLPYVGETPKI